MSINSVTITGNLGGEPELRYTSTGKAVCNFRIAVNDGFGESKKTFWFGVTAWGKQAESCNTYLTKGSTVGVTGRLTQREFEKAGQTTTVTEITATQVEFLSTKTKAATNGGDSFGIPEEEIVPF